MAYTLEGPFSTIPGVPKDSAASCPLKRQRLGGQPGSRPQGPFPLLHGPFSALYSGVRGPWSNKFLFCPFRRRQRQNEGARLLRARAGRGPGEARQGRARTGRGTGEDRARNGQGTRARTGECKGVRERGRKTLVFTGYESVSRAK